MKKKLMGFMLAFTMLISPTLVQAAAPYVYCSWSRNGCTVSVSQNDSSWSMNVYCEGDDEISRWGGGGTWGGDCHGGWVVL